jgi:hypothetical protein
MAVKDEIKDKTLLRLLNDISLRTNVPIETVKNAVFSQFKFLKINMSVGDKEDADSFLTIGLYKIGTFYPRKHFINFCKKNGVLEKNKQNINKYKKKRDEQRG